MDSKNLSVLAYSNGFTLWHYKAAADADAGAQGYFDKVGNIFNPGDVIFVSVCGPASATSIYTVAAASPGKASVVKMI
ncbi:MAG: hypothetical protein LBO78_02655 [Rickettsiales bacterium]|jgi:hypothetical protein|nr:hypothetical protein [Rickettsiales bacterium]